MGQNTTEMLRPYLSSKAIGEGRITPGQTFETYYASQGIET
jgi:hypothetical protein